MREVKKILVGLCLTENSPQVLALAAELAHRFEAVLVAANVINVKNVQSVSSVQSMGYDVDTKDYLRNFKEERREGLEQLIGQTGLPKDRVRTVVRVGHPVEELLTLIEEEAIDMVVIGAKGRSNLENFLLGSVAEKIVRHSPVTVVSYRDRRVGRTS